jgi:hypothetical protein
VRRGSLHDCGPTTPPKPKAERVSAFHASAIFAKPLADGVPLQYPTRMTGSISLLSPLRFVAGEPSRRAANRSRNLTGATQFTSAEEFAKSPRSCIIRSPKQFGLTCLGRFLALEHHRASANQTILVMLNAASLPHHRSGLAERVKTSCQELKSDTNHIAGFILDNWNNDKGNQRLLREIKAEYPNKPIIVLAGEDDFVQISMALEMHEENKMEILYLWALSRSNIRTLATSYIEGVDTLDEDLVTKKVTDDIDALNLHRTPLNCLLLLKLSEQAFDDTPVNRTEMIGRVLYLLFYQYDKIPRYATRPDLKDCEFALGYFCEALIRSGKTTFTIGEFYQKIQEYCSKQILDLDIEILFTFLLSENILVKKGVVYQFRFIYWLYYFAAHRMHHDSQFAEFILSERRYSAFPEIIEFYAGIDRMRTDAVVSLAKDLEEMDIDFLKRSGIPSNFNPYKHAQWAPTEEAVEQLKRQLDQSLRESALPTPIKDAIADQQYNRAQPYNQALAKFIKESSLLQMLQATRGAARALRNSDHVAPAAKADLLEKVLRCWVRACQTLIVLSPVLAQYGRATFDGISFYLDKSFGDLDTPRRRWAAVMNSVVDNVLTRYHQDIFSKKLGALFVNYVQAHHAELSELLLLLVLVKQRPPNWEREVEKFILREDKNAFALGQVYGCLLHEYKVGFCSERTRHQQKRLAAMALAKHATGAKRPNLRLIEKAAEAVEERTTGDKQLPPSPDRKS